MMMTRTAWLAMFWVLTLLPIPLFAQPDSPVPTNPEQLWSGYDPEALPLDVQLLEQWEEDGVALKKVFFTSEVWQGVPVRVYAIYGHPIGQTQLPAVLHIHGGGGTVSVGDVMFWAKRGYAAATFDHLGKHYDRTIYTQWGKVNSRPSYGSWETDPREDTYYHVVIASMRMITFLTRQPEVDPTRVGAYGISYGGSFIWMVSALDGRLKCVVPIVGAGSPPETWEGENSQRWSRCYNAYVYASRQQCPLLFLNGTDDFNATIDEADATFRQVSTDKRQAYELNYNHRLEPAVAGNLPAWMDTHLKGGPAWPASPEVSLTLGTDGVPLAMVQADGTQPIERVSVNYNLDVGAASPARHWRSVTAVGGGVDATPYQAALPIFDPSSQMRVYCDVLYRSGIVLSSVLTRVAPATLGEARATLQSQALIDDFALGNLSDWTCFPSGPDPLAQNPLMIPSVEGPEGGWAMQGNPAVLKQSFSVATAKIFDPQYRPGTQKGLKFQCRASEGSKLSVIVTRDFWKPTQTEFRSEVSIPAFGGWVPIQLHADDFKTKEGVALADWENLQHLRFVAEYPLQKPLMIGRVEWVE